MRPRQGVARLRAKRETRESLHMLSKVQRVQGNEPLHSQMNSHVGSWSFKWTPKFSKHDYRGQNPLPWRVIYIIGKLLKRKYLKWARIAHLDIWNTSYGQKKGRESNWQFESRPLKVKNWPDFLAYSSVWHTFEKLSTRATTLLRPHYNRRSAREVTRFQSRRNPSWGNFGTPTWESWDKKTIWMWPPWRGAEYTIRGKVMVSPKFGPWWILCVWVARGSS